MRRHLYIFNFDILLNKRFYIIWAIILIVYIFCYLFTPDISKFLSDLFGEKILLAGEGYIKDSNIFILNRIKELLNLIIILCLFATGTFFLNFAFVRYEIKWFFISLYIIIAVQFFVLSLTGTGLFWLVTKGQNLSNFNLKLKLASEVEVPRIFMVGSSQINAQINEQRLDELLDYKYSTSDLFCTGSQPFDLVLQQAIFQRTKPEMVICYLSEFDFHRKVQSFLFPGFMDFKGLIDYYILKKNESFKHQNHIVYSILGNILPLYKIRDLITIRIYGKKAFSIEEKNWNKELDSDLQKRAERFKTVFKDSETNSAFNERAFEMFVLRSKLAGTKIVVCIGQMNPILSDIINPSYRKQTLEFLRKIASQNGHVFLFESNAFPIQTKENYHDLTHVNDKTQIRFTQRLALLLKKIEF